MKMVKTFIYKQNYGLYIITYMLYMLLIYFSKGCDNSNTRSQLPNESKLENGLYMDEAISKISKKF